MSEINVRIKLKQYPTMSETKLPKEIIEIIKNVFGATYGELSGNIYPCTDVQVAKVVKLTSAHHEQENKRLVELLKEQWCANKSYELSGFDELNEEWQQYCKDNRINQNA